jgi:hypothetical protein
MRAALQGLVVSVADRAAEQVTRGWRADSAGAALLAASEATKARGERAKLEFENAFAPLPEPGTASQKAAAPPQPAEKTQAPPGGLDRASPDLAPRVTRAVSAWQDQLMRLVQAENLAKRVSGATYDIEPLSMVTLVAMLGEDGDARGKDDGSAQILSVPVELLSSAFGSFESKNLVDKARADLADRVRLLLDEELLRFIEVLDEVGPVDPVAAVRLYQAEYSLEAAR